MVCGKVNSRKGEELKKFIYSKSALFVMQDYKNLNVFKEAKQLAVDIYKLTRFYPQEEVFGMVQQLRRAVVSIGANIAEGSGGKKITSARGSTSHIITELKPSAGALIHLCKKSL